MSEVSLDFYKQPKVTQVFEKTIHLIKLNAIKSVNKLPTIGQY